MIKEARGFIKLMCSVFVSLILTYVIYLDVSPIKVGYIDVLYMAMLFISFLVLIQIFTHDPYK